MRPYAVCGETPGGATNIDTTSQQEQVLFDFGFNEDTATYGQTFTPTVTAYIKSFGFAVNLPATVKFQAYLYAWGGSNAVGPALYTSAVTTTTISTPNSQVLTFTVIPCLQLQAGTQYVIFLGSSGLWDNTGPSAGNLYIVPDTGYGGNYVYYNNGNNSAALTDSTWSAPANPSSFASSITYF